MKTIRLLITVLAISGLFGCKEKEQEAGNTNIPLPQKKEASLPQKKDAPRFDPYNSMLSPAPKAQDNSAKELEALESIKNLNREVRDLTDMARFNELTPERKYELLCKLLKSEKFDLFFSAFVVSMNGDDKNVDLPIYKKAIKEHPNYKALLGIGTYYVDSLKSLAEMGGDTPQNNELLAFQQIRMQEAFALLSDELGPVVKANKDKLLEILRSKFADGNDPKSVDPQIYGIGISFSLLKSDGLNIVLNSLEDVEDGKMFGCALSFFDETDALSASLKFFERDDLSRVQRMAAMFVIDRAKYANEDGCKVAVDALSKGRLTELPVKEENNWTPIMIKAMSGNADVVDYIGENVLPDADKNLRERMLELMKKIDPKSSQKYIK